MTNDAQFIKDAAARCLTNIEQDIREYGSEAENTIPGFTEEMCALRDKCIVVIAHLSNLDS